MSTDTKSAVSAAANILYIAQKDTDERRVYLREVEERLREYKEFTDTVAVYPKRYENSYLHLGFCGELGEVFNKTKKWLRGDYDGKNADDTEKFNQFVSDLEKELGDVIWYATRFTATRLTAGLLNIQSYDVVMEELDGEHNRDILIHMAMSDAMLRPDQPSGFVKEVTGAYLALIASVAPSHPVFGLFCLLRVYHMLKCMQLGINCPYGPGVYGYYLLEISSANQAKLQSRKERGQIQGSGDNR